MKTYKTWEVIKMLTENPNLKFTSNGDSIGIVDNQLIWLDSYKNVSLTLNCNMFVDMFNKDWALVQEPISYADAIAAWADGKKVICKHANKICIYNGFNHHSMVDQKGISLTKGAINYGKWFIDEQI